MDEKEKDEQVWYTVARACKYLDVSRATLYVYMADGRLPFYQFKGTASNDGSTRRRFKRSDLDALLEPGNPSALADDEGDDT
jgi:excisionase family DNA binding protein